MQSVVIVLVGLAGRAMPPTGSFLHHLPLIEILIAVGLLAMASMCLGLMVSALVDTSEKAVPFLVMLVVGQIVLSGGVVPLAGIAGLSQVSWIAPARWGLGSAASTVNVNALTPVTAAADPLWNHTSAAWLRDIGFTVALAVVYLIITWIQFRRLGPRGARPGPDSARDRVPHPCGVKRTTRDREILDVARIPRSAGACHDD